jgi:hypothetical protein
VLVAPRRWGAPLERPHWQRLRWQHDEALGSAVFLRVRLQPLPLLAVDGCGQPYRGVTGWRRRFSVCLCVPDPLRENVADEEEPNAHTAADFDRVGGVDPLVSRRELPQALHPAAKQPLYYSLSAG